ncbi:unnamed protein product [Cylicocyclus nassatus]|uniref:MADF domain-containing protein n=1 Tax=Cylicocyclus nassatus TaxID=53992 RepID=A0AA36GLQ8_CYLNA|nr:unnamed protein product [Cylicocyclus nassatus]
MACLAEYLRKMWKGMKQHYNRFKIKYSGSTAQTADPLVRKLSFLDSAAAPSGSTRMSNLNNDGDHELESSSVFSESLSQSSQPSSVARNSSASSSRKRRRLLAEDELNAVRSATSAVWDRLSEDVGSVGNKYYTFGAFIGDALNELPKAVADQKMQILFNALVTGADAYVVYERGEEVGPSRRYRFPEDVEVVEQYPEDVEVVEEVVGSQERIDV